MEEQQYKDTKRKDGFDQYIGDALQEGQPFGPGSCYQIVIATCDIPLVSSLPPHYTIGRPITYLAFDAFSQMIAGVHVSLASPSWEGVFRCLLNLPFNQQQGEGEGE